MLKRIITCITIIIFTFNLVSCASKKEKEVKKEPEFTAEQLYEDGSKKLSLYQLQGAADIFAKISQEYPYSKLAIKAQIMEGYAYYKKHDYDSSISIFENFIKLHPTNSYAPYAYYMKFLGYYEQINDVNRDQKITEEAKDAAEELLSRFPESTYGRDAKFKLVLINDHLSGKEMQIGRFYLNKEETLASINRFREVVEKYQTTSQIEEALYRLVEGYLTLGVKEEAQRYAAVLGYNYPNSKWYKRSYNLMNKYNKTHTHHHNAN